MADLGWVAVGLVTLGLGYVLDVLVGLGASTNPGGYACGEAGWAALVPIVGGWIHFAVNEGCGSYSQAGAHVVGGLLQAGGLLAAILAAVLPVEEVVEGDGRESVRLVIGTPGAELGVSLVVRGL